jgi:Tol biopolymer transport system component
VSPDGTRLAFVRVRTEGVADLWIAPLARPGDARRLSHDERTIQGLAWADGGTALLFTSNRGGAPQLWRWRLDEPAPAVVPVSARNAGHISAAAGGRIVYHEYDGSSNVWSGRAETAPVSAWAVSSRSEWGVRLSPDGTRLAFISDRTGAPEVWVGDVDGGDARMISDEGGATLDPPSWSSDGRRVAWAAARAGDFDVFVADLETGTVDRVTEDPSDDRTPTWLGKAVVFASDRSGRFELWSKKPGGPPRAMTEGGAFGPVRGDGTIYFVHPEAGGIWRWEGHDRPAVRVWSDLGPDEWGNWRPTSEGLLRIRATGAEARIERLDPERGTTTVLRRIDAEIPSAAGVGVASDGRLFWTQVDRSEADLWLLEPAGAR